MIENLFIDEIKRTLSLYREAIPKAEDDEAKADYSNLAAITDKLLNAIQEGESTNIRYYIYAFHRAVSDYFSKQPPEYRPLADAIEKVEKIVK